MEVRFEDADDIKKTFLLDVNSESREIFITVSSNNDGFYPFMNYFFSTHLDGHDFDDRDK